MKARPSSSRPIVKIGDQPHTLVCGFPFGSLVTNTRGAKFGPYHGGTAVVVISPGVDDPLNGIYWVGRTSK